MRSSTIAAFGLASAVSATPRHHGRAAGSPDAAKAQAVKEVYQESWRGYYQYAFPNDTLNPVSETYQNDRLVFVHHSYVISCSFTDKI